MRMNAFGNICAGQCHRPSSFDRGSLVLLDNTLNVKLSKGIAKDLVTHL